MALAGVVISSFLGSEVLVIIKFFNLFISSALAARSLTVDEAISLFLFFKSSSEIAACGEAPLAAVAGSLTTAFCEVPPSAVIFFNTSFRAVFSLEISIK